MLKFDLTLLTVLSQFNFICGILFWKRYSMETGSVKFKTCSRTRLKTHMANSGTFHQPSLCAGSEELTEHAALGGSGRGKIRIESAEETDCSDIHLSSHKRKRKFHVKVLTL